MSVKSILVMPAAALGLVALAACGGSSDQDSSASATTTPAVTTPAATTPAAVATTADTSDEYAPIPVNPASSAAAKDLDFGTLTKITTKGGVITLHIDRAHFYVGDEAKAHNKGRTPLDDYVVEDTDGKKEFTFTLDPKASIQAEANLQKDLANTDERVNLTRKQFIANVNALVAQNAGQKDPDSVIRIYVWLRHTGGPNGPVTAIADQYTA